MEEKFSSLSIALDRIEVLGRALEILAESVKEKMQDAGIRVKIDDIVNGAIWQATQEQRVKTNDEESTGG